MRGVAVSSTAWMLLGLGVASVAAGAVLGWIELLVVGVTSIVAVLACIPFVVGGRAIHLHRELPPETRVVAGPRIEATLVASNPPKSPRTPAMTIEEEINGVPHPLEIGGLSGGEQKRSPYPLPTERRGVVRLGPATIARSDPFGLLRNSVGHLPEEVVWVHPESRIVAELPAGFAKDLEGPTYDTSPAGDVAFHTIREYAPGDDIRHIHWMSTARQPAGTLMVRHYVDNRRTELTVVVDDGLAGRSGDLFERAMEVAASLGLSGIARKLVPDVIVGETHLLRSNDPLQAPLFLDRVAEYTSNPRSDLVSSIARALDETPSTSVLVLVTGCLSAEDLRAVCDRFRRRCRLLVVNVVEGSDRAHAVSIPRTTTLHVADLDEFEQRWRSLS